MQFKTEATNKVNLTSLRIFKVLTMTIFIRSLAMASTYRNLALNKSANQSTTHKHLGKLLCADIAVDGVDGDNTENCTHTLFGAVTHWWYVDLGDIYTIASIGIRNRRGGSSKRLSNFTVQVSNQDPTSLAGFPGDTSVSICIEITSPVPSGRIIIYSCDQPVSGRYVFIIKPSTAGSPLSICEFEVYENKLWRFAFVTNQGEGQALTTSQARRYITNCARLHVNDPIISLPYIQIDLPSETCRFLTTFTESQNSLSDNCVLYKLE